MRIIKSFTLFILIGIAVVGMTVSSATAATITTLPTGLNPGDQYRLAFVTSTTRDATSADISKYNSHVSFRANSVQALADLNVAWKAIASTLFVNARENTGADPDVKVGIRVPIYRLDGELIANDDRLDLWDGNLLRAINIDELGNLQANIDVWTGTLDSGFVLNTFPLGQAVGNTQFALAGNTGFSDTKWIANSVFETSENKSFYALSAPITVVGVIPLPAALPLYGTGLALMGFIGWRRQRQQQV